MAIMSGIPAGADHGDFDEAGLRSALHTLPLPQLMAWASELRDAGHASLVTYSPKVFIPLTRLCRDVCHYCTFAQPPRHAGPAYLSREQVLDIARAGAAAGCTEALLTLGDKPELRYSAARNALDELGHPTTIDYVAEICGLIVEETGLLPHVNAGVMDSGQIATLRRVSVSQGLMLENVSPRLGEHGGPHHGSPDKYPAARLATIAAAGALAVPFTSGLLVGIGESRDERIDSLFALHALHRDHGHVQELIIQNFRRKPGTRMAAAPEPGLEELLWTIAAARIVFGPRMNIQAPPNLSPGTYPELIRAGINDWGGISPVTRDHVNPEAPWPEITELARRTAMAGKVLAPRLPVYSDYLAQAGRWVDPGLLPHVLRACDGQGLGRGGRWSPGAATTPTPIPTIGARDSGLHQILARAAAGNGLDEHEIVRLFEARGGDFEDVCLAADELRRTAVGDTVTYAVNRNINYTNVCGYRCAFCAFSKSHAGKGLRDTPYEVSLAEVARRTEEAWARGATEVCMQGGIHPEYTGETYLAFCRAAKEAAPGIHVHAFSPLEVHHGAATLGLSLDAFLERLGEAGLGSLPGTAAEILDDEVRAVLCPDKIDTARWLEVMASAHRVGLPTTATIMFGHVDGYRHWARHLLRIRALQTETGGFTEFVPLPFVHMEAPIYLRGRARRGPTSRETILMHAVARLVLHSLIDNIQTSWVKLGSEGARLCLAAGANDLGGTLMNESISRAAGTEHGQELPPPEMHKLIESCGRLPRQRTTLYRDVDQDRRSAGWQAEALAPVINERPRRKRLAITADNR
ncbi:MAG: FO synthase [Alphaproteobacteria bacterium]|nr:MAG: FO synthase [Alphaproteobacteria bacterium]